MLDFNFSTGLAGVLLAGEGAELSPRGRSGAGRERGAPSHLRGERSLRSAVLAPALPRSLSLHRESRLQGSQEVRASHLRFKIWLIKAETFAR